MKLGEVINHRKGFITIDDDLEYKLCRVQVNRKGVVLREIIKGKQIKTKKQQVCKAGDFIVAEMDAKVGGYGFIPDELEGAIVSSHYFLFELNEARINPAYLNILSKHGFFQDQIKAVGSTNYAAIRPKDVLNWDISLPSLKQQLERVLYIGSIEKLMNTFLVELNSQISLIASLRQTILTEAVSGQLTSQWRKENPHQEPASELLKRIAIEKDQLIKEKKISKEKLLPPILAEEMSYDLPEGWLWCRLGEVTLSMDAGKSPQCENRPASLSEWGVLKTTSIQNLNFDDSENKALPQNIKFNGALEVRANDILITRAGPRNRVGIVCSVKTTRPNLLLSDKTIRVRISESYLSAESTAILLSSGESGYFLDSKKSGMADSQVNISQDNMKLTPIPLIPVAEQRVIVQKVNTIMSYCDQLENQVQQCKADLDLLMQSILSEVFGTENRVIGNKAVETDRSKKETMIQNEVIQSIYEGNSLNMELLEILQQQGGKIAAVNLWKMSKFQKDIDAFYEALKKEVEEKKTIKESAEKGWLELVEK